MDHRTGMECVRRVSLLCLLIFASQPLLAADKQKPTAPTGLTATAVSDTQINLSWTASTDNVGVTGYFIERCTGTGCATFGQITTTTTTTYSNTGLTPATSYSYRVRATDAAGNLSNYSSVATRATPADTTAPTVPTGLNTSARLATEIDLRWTASTDDVAVTLYRVERCTGSSCSNFVEIGTNTTTTFNSTGLSPLTNYRFRVRASDAAGNLSSYSTVLLTSTPAGPDTVPPSAPSGLSTTVISSTQINLSWAAATDNVGVTGYRVERCQNAGCSSFTQIATPATTTYSDTGLTGSTSYSYRILAYDAAGNLSGYSNTSTATTAAPPDTQPPSTPSGMAANAISPTQINVNWASSTDNVGVTGYLLERCQGTGCSVFSQIASVSGTNYNDTSLVGATSYSYRVRATDAASNLSGYSNVASATTLTPPDTQPPTIPPNPSATAISSSAINLSWSASTDNVGVTAYLLERCQGSSCSNFTQIASLTTLVYHETGLPSATAYNYRVRAKDAAGNMSGYSDTMSAVTANPGSLTYSYTYDDLGRVIHVAGSDGSSVDYQYDVNGNMTSITRQ